MNNQLKFRLSDSFRRQRIVLVGGCFDLIHYGHITFLTAARRHGDVLIVALESDRNVRSMKGSSRPIHTQSQRQTMLETLRSVDAVIPLPVMTSDNDYDSLVRYVRPQVIAATESDPILGKKTRQAEKYQATIVVIPRIHTPSTSQLVKLLNLD